MAALTVYEWAASKVASKVAPTVCASEFELVVMLGLEMEL